MATVRFSSHFTWNTCKNWVHITESFSCSFYSGSSDLFCFGVFVIYRADGGFWLSDGNMLSDGSRRDRIQTAVLHSSRRRLGGLGLILADPGGLLLGREAVLAAAWLALVHAGGTRGHSHLSTTHCTLNRTMKLVVRKERSRTVEPFSIASLHEDSEKFWIHN